MNTRVDTFSVAAPAAPPAAKAGVALGIGLGGIALTAAGLFVAGPKVVAVSWLVAIGYWTAIALGMLFLVILHHMFDANWSTVIRRQFEHGLAAFKWLLILFLPLLLVSWFYEPGLVWSWMDPHALIPGHHERVGEDILYLKKSGYLNLGFFTVRAVLYYGIWIGLASILRRNSFRQDTDGDVKWTLSSRKWSA
ncbi:MAG: hypothetical protein ABSD56_13710, partial [Bryobacteraceae bacterium]